MADASRAAGTVVVALGGNTLLGEYAPWTADEQVAAVDRTATHLAAAMAEGYDLVLTHGNGPQVGNLLLQQERATDTPQFPLDVLVAETQAQIGYLLQRALDNERPAAADALTLVTQVVVDGSDPAFERPTKPVGPFYSAAAARERDFETRRVSDGERPFRRVVPSPSPVEVVERDEIGRLAARGKPVICAGGGGVPVVREDGLRGVEAVIDKDRTAALLATDLDADALVVLTDVPHACVDYGTPDERPLREVDPETLRGHLAAGEFAEGSMRPKVEACLAFVDGGGDRAVVTTPERLGQALAGEAGTRVG